MIDIIGIKISIEQVILMAAHPLTHRSHCSLSLGLHSLKLVLLRLSDHRTTAQPSLKVYRNQFQSFSIFPFFWFLIFFFEHHFENWSGEFQCWRSDLGSGSRCTVEVGTLTVFIFMVHGYCEVKCWLLNVITKSSH